MAPRSYTAIGPDGTTSYRDPLDETRRTSYQETTPVSQPAREPTDIVASPSPAAGSTQTAIGQEPKKDVDVMGMIGQGMDLAQTLSGMFGGEKGAGTEGAMSGMMGGGEGGMGGVNPVGMAFDMAGQGLDALTTANQKQAALDYQSDLEAWKDQGKLYFDPNYDISPNLDQFLDGLPTETEMLAEGSPIQNRGLAISQNPAQVFGEMAWGEQKGGYVAQESWRESVKGFGEGFKYGGPWGGIIGAVVMGVAGIFTAGAKYDKAEKRDQKLFNRARKEYWNMMEKWYFERQTKKRDAAALQVTQRRAAGKQIADEKQRKKDKRMQGREKASQAFAAIVANAGSNKAKRRDRIASMWKVAA